MTRLGGVVLWTVLAATLPVSAQTGMQSDVDLKSEPTTTRDSGVVTTERVSFAPRRDVTTDMPASSFPTGRTSWSLPPRSYLAGRDLAVLQTASPAGPSAIVSPAGASGTLPEKPVPAATPNTIVTERILWGVTGGLFEASIANAETLVRCPNCTAVPASAHRRAFTYGVGLPLDVAVSYLSYKMIKKGHRWALVVPVALTVANGYLSYHWAVNTP